MIQPVNNGHWLALYSVDELVGFYDRYTKTLVWASHTSESSKQYPRFNLTTRQVSLPVG